MSPIHKDGKVLPMSGCLPSWIGISFWHFVLPPLHSRPQHCCALPPSSQMDPIQKAVISHTFGVPSPLKKKLFISCNICHLRFNSSVRGSSGNRLGRGLGRERPGHWVPETFLEV